MLLLDLIDDPPLTVGREAGNVAGSGHVQDRLAGIEVGIFTVIALLGLSQDTEHPTVTAGPPGVIVGADPGLPLHCLGKTLHL